MKPYFEEVKTFAHSVKGEEKNIPRISVDMGLHTYINFVLNELAYFGNKYGGHGQTYKADLDKILVLIDSVISLLKNKGSYYTFVDFLNEDQELSLLSHNYEQGGVYDINFWECSALTIIHNYVIIEG